MSQTKILVVDDEERMRSLIRDYLLRERYSVIEAADGEEALEKFFDTKDIKLILLDIMMPRMNGYELTKKIRESNNIPIIILSAKNSDDDIINGLKFGADDYIPKPFSVPMLLARIEGVLRRSRQSAENEGKLIAGNLKVDFREYRGTRGTKELAFTRKEIEILEFLWSRRDTAVPRAELLRKVWGYENAESVDTRTVDIHITKLRKKIEDDPSHPKLLVTFRGEGYQLCSNPECTKST